MAGLSKRLGISRATRPSARKAERRGAAREAALRRDIDLSALEVPLQVVVDASRAAAFLAGSMGTAAAACALLLFGPEQAALLGLVAAIAPPLAAEAVRSYPSSVAARRAARVLKDSTGAASLMIMSLRHEASVPKAIMFASGRKGEFSKELRRCTWAVVMGRHHTFEEALQRLGDRWARHSGELKAALNSMVTASCEATEEGRRRALDRANRSMVAGARRRIEEYALSLSTPSMVMFGLGILLPIMVGSFLPMMSWDIWAPSMVEAPETGNGTDAVLRTAFIMNLVFPLIAFMVANDAASRHPLERVASDGRSRAAIGVGPAIAVTSASATMLACSFLFLDEVWMAAGLLLSVTLPLGAGLMVSGAGGSSGRDKPASGACLDDGLFRVGARMLEGENFETAVRRAADDCGDEGVDMRRLAVASCVLGLDFERAAEDTRSMAGSNTGEAFVVVREAARKDETAAGLLAMDVATYLRDLRELEASLKSRLRPTVSMMRMTAHVLGPVVLGVTYSIYLALSGMMDGQGMDPRWLFVILGAFLAEINVAVTYFVWGIQGRPGGGALAYSAGACLMISELVYAATAIVAR